ncbi:MAG: type I methionyl aminopeptidase, partial [Algoriphagus sp. 32-45-6]
MIYYKTSEEIQKIRESADILGRAHGEVAKHIKEGVKTSFLDKVAEEFIRDHGGVPSFKGYNGFPASLCISVNEVVVHGFPSDYELKDGDIISVDCGVFHQGFHSDSAYTYPVGEVSPSILSLLRATRDSLYLGIEQAKFGNRVGDIGHAI